MIQEERKLLMDHHHSQTISDGSSSKYIITGMRNSIPKLIVTTILTVCSGGLLLLAMHWYPKINVILTKKKSNLGVATHVHIHSPETDLHGITRIKSSGGCRYFTYQHSKYIFECGEILLVNGLENLHYSDIHAMSGGVTDSVLEYKLERYGPNVIDVPVPSYIVLFFKEALQPFYIFQAFAVTLWMIEGYVQYATAILIISFGSIAITIFEQRKQKKKINKMAASSVEIEVLRNGENLVLPSCDLVPGDVMLIPRDGLLLCCDAVLVSGSAIVNECALTGESIPVSKASVPYISKFIYESGDVEKVSVSEDLVFNPERDKKYSLLSGTTVIQSKPTSGSHSVAIVMRTGFSTFKGSLIRAILCPKPTKFEFQADAQRFIMMLSFFAAFGFAYTFYISLKLGGSIAKTLRLGLDLITVVVPPALPAALTIGVVYAIQRLKTTKVFCIDPQRVNFCGNVQFICFDKTGTLTEDGLSILCVVPSASIFLAAIRKADLIKQDRLLHAMAACHEISKINGEYIGDPLDIEMFKFTGWSLEDCDELNPLASFVSAIVSSPIDDVENEDPAEIGIIRIFPFTSELQRMAVVTKSLQTEEMIVFCKGSPEMIHSLSRKETIPHNFYSELDSYTNEGYRVIAFGWKVLDSETSWHSIQTMRRSQFECNLNFCGFLIMENHLKEDTTSCISELYYSNTKVCMVTGDNIFTAISVSKKCGIVPIDNGLNDVIVVKKEGESVAFQLDSKEKSSVTLPVKYSQQDIVTAISGITDKPYVLAVTETAFNHVALFHPLVYELLLLKGKIFARMKPGKKQKLVEDLQKIGYTVSMCGDGANDCGALKAAHAGVSLSEAEASIAAPFTSANPSISCMIEILRQGRAALVTASVTFRFMAMYSLIQFITSLLHYSIGTNMTDSQFLYIDMFVISAIAATLGLSQPAAELAPTTPKAQLIDFKVFVLLSLHVLITFGFQFSAFVYIKSQPFYVPYVPAHDLQEGACFENTALFICSAFQYALYGVIFCVGAPHRKPAYRNWILMLVFLVCVVMSVVFVFQPIPFLNNLMNLVSLQQLDVKVTFILLMALNFVLVYLVEELFNTNKVSRYLDGVKIFLNKAKPEFVILREGWENLHSDFNSKNFYK